MRWHLLALVPVIIGSIAQLCGLQGVFVLGAVGTLIGIGVSYAVMFMQAFGLATSTGIVAVLTLVFAGGTAAIRDAQPQNQATVSARR